ncbi:hypothetical protein FWH30_01650, partial [Microgenomates group bacterium]|nr:hypothetical protein [Microgenomates group bacterium]
MNILSTKKLLITALTIWGVLLNTSSVRAQTAVTLGDLPIGSVIQIMGTDTGMCDTSAGNAGNCATQNAPVLPYKLVKMLARNSDGTAKVGNSGFGAAGNYTYWMLMDNYCWWGSANCYYLGNRSGAYQSFNHDNSGSAGTSPTNYHNNLSIHLANNILIRLDNFYNSLPAQIGGFTKAAAIPTYDWDMMPMSNGNPSVAGWGSTHGTWTAGTYNPSGDTTNQFVFSGGNGAPVMNSRIGLLSYTEWQGGTFAYGQYPGRSGGISLAAVAANTVGNGT